MTDILLSFVGNHDPFDPVDQTDGPILNLLAHKPFDLIYLFYNSDKYLRQASDLNREIQKRGILTQIRYVPIEINNPTDYTVLFPLINNACQNILSENLTQNPEYFIALASGTPQMHTIWVLLQQSGLFPAKLLQAVEPKFRKGGPPVREITFEIDNFPKIVSPDEIKRRLNISELKREQLEAERQSLVGDFGFGEIIGQSEVLRKEINKAAKVATSEIPVLITGETGTGKELIARAIHFNSPRRENPYISVNCAALPENLIESELFGHTKGAFTGASTHKKGKFQLADNGTIFLDEIGDMPLTVQAKILRVLQEGEFSPLGSEETIKVDVRLISATNKNLPEEQKNKRFRDDLYYRLKGLIIHLPPLRERKTDILLLAEHILSKIMTPNSHPKLVTDAQRFLVSYTWPGNIRELKQCLETAAVLAEEDVITAAVLHDLVQHEIPTNASPKFDLPLDHFDLKHMLEDLEKDLIRQTLLSENSNLTRTAVRLGMTRQNLSKKIEKYGIAI